MKFNKFFLTLIAISTLKAIVRTPEEGKELQQNINLADESCLFETFESQEQRYRRNTENTPLDQRQAKKIKNLAACLLGNRIAFTALGNNPQNFNVIF